MFGSSMETVSATFPGSIKLEEAKALGFESSLIYVDRETLIESMLEDLEKDLPSKERLSIRTPDEIPLATMEHVRRYIRDSNLTSKEENCNSGGDTKSRKHCRYRKSSEDGKFEGEKPFEREFSFRTSKGQTIMPGMCRLDSGSDIPLVVSRRWIKEAGKGAEISTNFKSPSSYSLSGHAMEFTGIIRNLVFNPKGSSTIYRRDFLVCDQLDSFVDFIIGAKFMLEEWQILFGNMKRRIAGWFNHKKETPLEQAEA
ncbi:hypothetical protein BCON_0128g00070 [Botryotinia convoluta]|uniref:Uncharacterized protein n=1 Tax=Botryotinia convoluta TaxID=54673 RepID=A0A4Z1I374_9HELO|nr:hypothetical protein BCON_0128g00070 [Botryotinia convoluta]